jgi:hypothetical protein
MKQRKYNNNNKNERMRAASRLRTREEQSKKTPLMFYSIFISKILILDIFLSAHKKKLAYFF